MIKSIYLTPRQPVSKGFDDFLVINDFNNLDENHLWNAEYVIVDPQLTEVDAELLPFLQEACGHTVQVMKAVGLPDVSKSSRRHYDNWFVDGTYAYPVNPNNYAEVRGLSCIHWVSQDAKHCLTILRAALIIEGQTSQENVLVTTNFEKDHKGDLIRCEYVQATLAGAIFYLETLPEDSPVSVSMVDSEKKLHDELEKPILLSSDFRKKD